MLRSAISCGRLVSIRLLMLMLMLVLMLVLMLMMRMMVTNRRISTHRPRLMLLWGVLLMMIHRNVRMPHALPRVRRHSRGRPLLRVRRAIHDGVVPLRRPRLMLMGLLLLLGMLLMRN